MVKYFLILFSLFLGASANCNESQFSKKCTFSMQDDLNVLSQFTSAKILSVVHPEKFKPDEKI